MKSRMILVHLVQVKTRQMSTCMNVTSVRMSLGLAHSLDRVTCAKLW